ncbi:hypothetical protein RJT34_01879 [Clitoria ternatea]|uniref:Thioredoxin domain-containing protein n=1 Tax=Clitoria ternatea TaxID=43366 RepID=A0AAN9KJE1_CLITE
MNNLPTRDPNYLAWCTLMDHQSHPKSLPFIPGPYFDSLKQTNKLTVIDFSASWCGPCKLMDPAIQEFAEKYTDVEFVKIDVDKLLVQAMPTFLLIKKGRVTDKVVGVRKEELQRLIDQHRK